MNDTLTDKASYTFHLTVPKPYVAAANGVLVRTEQGDSQTFVWEMDEPIASYLATVTVGRRSESRLRGRGTVRNYFAPRWRRPRTTRSPARAR